MRRAELIAEVQRIAAEVARLCTEVEKLKKATARPSTAK
jgi:hypothetical protein